MSTFELTPITYVRGARTGVEDDYWGGAESRIELTDAVEESALEGIDSFSHVEVLFVFDRVEPAKIVHGARHPRNNAAWPLTGILAQRAKIKPVLREFLPREQVRQPAWATELMREYWLSRK